MKIFFKRNGSVSKLAKIALAQAAIISAFYGLHAQTAFAQQQRQMQLTTNLALNASVIRLLDLDARLRKEHRRSFSNIDWFHDGANLNTVLDTLGIAYDDSALIDLKRLYQQGILSPSVGPQDLDIDRSLSGERINLFNLYSGQRDILITHLLQQCAEYHSLDEAQSYCGTLPRTPDQAASNNSAAATSTATSTSTSTATSTTATATSTTTTAAATSETITTSDFQARGHMGFGAQGISVYQPERLLPSMDVSAPTMGISRVQLVRDGDRIIRNGDQVMIVPGPTVQPAGVHTSASGALFLGGDVNYISGRNRVGADVNIGAGLSTDPNSASFVGTANAEYQRRVLSRRMGTAQGELGVGARANAQVAWAGGQSQHFFRVTPQATFSVNSSGNHNVALTESDERTVSGSAHQGRAYGRAGLDIGSANVGGNNVGIVGPMVGVGAQGRYQIAQVGNTAVDAVGSIDAEATLNLTSTVNNLASGNLELDICAHPANRSNGRPMISGCGGIRLTGQVVGAEANGQVGLVGTINYGEQRTAIRRTAVNDSQRAASNRAPAVVASGSANSAATASGQSAPAAASSSASSAH